MDIRIAVTNALICFPRHPDVWNSPVSCSEYPDKTRQIINRKLVIPSSKSYQKNQLTITKCPVYGPIGLHNNLLVL